MAPPPPKDSIARARELLKIRQAEVNAEQQLADIASKVAAGQINTIANFDKRQQALRKLPQIIKSVTDSIDQSTMSAKEYAKVVEGRVGAIIKLYEEQNVAIEEGIKLNEKAEKAVLSMSGTAKDWLKDHAASFIAGASAATAYEKRVEEVRAGHKLFLSSEGVLGEKNAATWAKTQSYVEGYRFSQRRAWEVSKLFGESQEEVAATASSVAKKLRSSMLPAGKDFGHVILDQTKMLYQYSNVLGVDVSEALDDMKDQMWKQGKPIEATTKSLETMMTTLDRLTVVVPGAMTPFKDDYYKVLKEINAEMGPVTTDTAALSAVMEQLAKSAGKAGMSGDYLANSLTSIPKVMKQLPVFYQQQIGSKFMDRLQQDTKFLDTLPKNIQDQVKAIQATDLPLWDKQQAVYQSLLGTKEGIQEVFGKLSGMSAIVRQGILRSVGVEGMDLVSMENAFKNKDLTPEKLAEVQGIIEKATKRTGGVRQELSDKLLENTAMLDRGTIGADNLNKTIQGLIKENIELVAATAMLTKVMGMQGLAEGVASGLGRWGVTAGAAGAVGIAGLIGVAVGMKVGQAISDWWDSKDDKVKKTEGEAKEGKVKEFRVALDKQLEGKEGMERLAQMYRNWQSASVATTDLNKKDAPELFALKKSLYEDMRAETKNLIKEHKYVSGYMTLNAPRISTLGTKESGGLSKIREANEANAAVTLSSSRTPMLRRSPRGEFTVDYARATQQEHVAFNRRNSRSAYNSRSNQASNAEAPMSVPFPKFNPTTGEVTLHVVKLPGADDPAIRQQLTYNQKVKTGKTKTR